MRREDGKRKALHNNNNNNNNKIHTVANGEKGN
jgi:hypothetical protein